MNPILIIDNYDSFVYNLARYIGLLGFERNVVRNDKITLEEIETLQPSAIVISPGPCTPREANICIPLIQKFYNKIPLLGICLGHQAIGEAFGGQVIPARHPIHGQSTPIYHEGESLFKQLENPLSVGRYHSLIVCEKTLPPCLKPLAYCEEGQLMALEHVSYPVVGLQFHPESILTQRAFQMLNYFFTAVPTYELKSFEEMQRLDAAQCAVEGVS